MQACGTYISFYKSPYRVIAAIITVWAFLFNTIGTELAWATNFSGPVLPASGTIGLGSSGQFHIPAELGKIKEVSTGHNEKTVIYIQDVHCNYTCQKSVEAIIDHLTHEYGIGMVALEGGVGDYDLSVFTDIEDEPLRERVADYFVKEGLVNGAELFAIMNLGKVTLKGLENNKLYLENLKSFTEGMPNKGVADVILSGLKNVLGELKEHVYSEAISGFEKMEAGYYTGEYSLKEYLAYLAPMAERSGVIIEDHKNISDMLSALEREENIDFKKANRERERLIKTLARRLSKPEKRRLLEESFKFKKEEVKETEFYSYLFKKSKTVGIVIDKNYENLLKFKEYIEIYHQADQDQLFSEIEAIKSEVLERLFEDKSQRDLYDYSKNADILKRLFSIAITPKEYKRYKDNRGLFSASTFKRFISRTSSRYNIDTRIPDDISKLDVYKKEIERFYKIARKRDSAFIKNIASYLKDRDSLIVVTGGFHSENLKRLFKRKGYSYINILPKFEFSEETPYKRLLSGGITKEEAAINDAISNLALPSLFSEIKVIRDSIRGAGRLVWPAEAKRLAILLKKLSEEGKALVLEIKGPNGEFVMRKTIEKAQDGEEYVVRDGSTMVELRESEGYFEAVEIAISDFSGVRPLTYGAQEELIDEPYKKKYEDPANIIPLRDFDTGRDEDPLSTGEMIVELVTRSLSGLGPCGVYAAVNLELLYGDKSKKSPDGHPIITINGIPSRINLVRVDRESIIEERFLPHAGGMGISIPYYEGMPAGEIARCLFHEALAGNIFGDPREVHELAEEVTRLAIDESDLDGASALLNSKAGSTILTRTFFGSGWISVFWKCLGWSVVLLASLTSFTMISIENGSIILPMFIKYVAIIAALYSIIQIAQEVYLQWAFTISIRDLSRLSKELSYSDKEKILAWVGEAQRDFREVRAFYKHAEGGVTDAVFDKVSKRVESFWDLDLLDVDSKEKLYMLLRKAFCDWHSNEERLHRFFDLVYINVMDRLASFLDNLKYVMSRPNLYAGGDILGHPVWLMKKKARAKLPRDYADYDAAGEDEFDAVSLEDQRYFKQDEAGALYQNREDIMSLFEFIAKGANDPDILRREISIIDLHSQLEEWLGYRFRPDVLIDTLCSIYSRGYFFEGEKPKRTTVVISDLARVHIESYIGTADPPTSLSTSVSPAELCEAFNRLFECRFDEEAFFNILAADLGAGYLKHRDSRVTISEIPKYMPEVLARFTTEADEEDEDYKNTPEFIVAQVVARRDKLIYKKYRNVVTTLLSNTIYDSEGRYTDAIAEAIRHYTNNPTLKAARQVVVEARQRLESLGFTSVFSYDTVQIGNLESVLDVNKACVKSTDIDSARIVLLDFLQGNITEEIAIIALMQYTVKNDREAAIDIIRQVQPIGIGQDSVHRTDRQGIDPGWNISKTKMTYAEQLMQILRSYPLFGADGFTVKDIVEFIVKEGLDESSPLPSHTRGALIQGVQMALKVAADTDMLIRRLLPIGKGYVYIYFRPSAAKGIVSHTVNDTVETERMQYVLDVLEGYLLFGREGFTAKELVALFETEGLTSSSPFERFTEKQLYKNIMSALKTAAERRLLIRRPIEKTPGYMYYRPGQDETVVGEETDRQGIDPGRIDPLSLTEEDAFMYLPIVTAFDTYNGPIPVEDDEFIKMVDNHVLGEAIDIEHDLRTIMASVSGFFELVLLSDGPAEVRELCADLNALCRRMDDMMVEFLNFDVAENPGGGIMAPASSLIDLALSFNEMFSDESIALLKEECIRIHEEDFGLPPEDIPQSVRLFENGWKGLKIMLQNSLGLSPEDRKYINIHRLLDIASIVEAENFNTEVERRYDVDILELFLYEAALFRVLVNIIRDGREAGNKIILQTSVIRDNVVINISDNGPGMSQDKVEKFNSGEDVETTKGERHGHGLGIVRRLIWENGGEVKVHAERDKGTTYTITIPLAEYSTQSTDRQGIDPADEPRPLSAEEVRSLERKYKSRLWAGDDLDMRSIMRREEATADITIGRGRNVIWRKKGDVIGQLGAYYCNYVVVSDRKTNKAALIHTSIMDTNDAEEALRESCSMLGIRLGRKDAKEYLSRNVVMAIARPTSSATITKWKSELIEEVFTHAGERIGIPQLQADINDLWRTRAVKFLVDERMFISTSIGIEGESPREIVHSFRLDETPLRTSTAETTDRQGIDPLEGALYEVRVKRDQNDLVVEFPDSDTPIRASSIEQLPVQIENRLIANGFTNFRSWLDARSGFAVVGYEIVDGHGTRIITVGSFTFTAQRDMVELFINRALRMAEEVEKSDTDRQGIDPKERIEAAFIKAKEIFDFDNWPDDMEQPLAPEIILYEEEASKYPQYMVASYGHEERRALLVYPHFIKRFGSDSMLEHAVIHEYGHGALYHGKTPTQGLGLAYILRYMIGVWFDEMGRDDLHAQLASNIYEDLIINLFLQRYHSLEWTEYAKTRTDKRIKNGSITDFWRIFVKTFEMTAGVEAGSIISEDQSRVIDSDAQELANLFESILEAARPDDTVGQGYYDLSARIFDVAINGIEPFCEIMEKYIDQHAIEMLQHDEPEGDASDTDRQGIDPKGQVEPTGGPTTVSVVYSEELISDFNDWFSRHGQIEWDGGPRYGTVKASLAYYKRGEFMAIKHTCQVYPNEDWKAGYPEMQKLEEERDGFRPKAGTFGELCISWYVDNSGHRSIFVEEIQPNDGYRKLSKGQRRNLDAWRRATLHKIIEYARSRDLLVFAATPELIKEVYEDISEYELRINYSKFFADDIWHRQELAIGIPDSVDALLSTYAHFPQGPVSCYAYQGNAEIAQSLKPDRKTGPIDGQSSKTDRQGIDPKSKSADGTARISEEEFVELVGSDAVFKFRECFKQLFSDWHYSKENSAWHVIIRSLEENATSLNDQGWGIQKIAEMADHDWAMSDKWKRYEKHFRYKMRHIMQEMHGVAVTLDRGADHIPDPELDKTLVDYIDSLLNEVTVILTELWRNKSAIPEITTKLTDREWDRLLRVQDVHWDFFRPFGGHILPAYWPAPRGTLAPSPILQVAELQKEAGVNSESNIFDIGAGAGQPSAIAASVFGANATGYEIHEILVEYGHDWMRALTQAYPDLMDPGQVNLIERDYKSVSLNGFTHLYAFPASEANRYELDEWIIEQDIGPGVKLIILNDDEFSNDDDIRTMWPKLTSDDRWEFRRLPHLRGIIFEKIAATDRQGIDAMEAAAKPYPLRTSTAETPPHPDDTQDVKTFDESKYIRYDTSGVPILRGGGRVLEGDLSDALGKPIRLVVLTGVNVHGMIDSIAAAVLSDATMVFGTMDGKYFVPLRPDSRSYRNIPDKVKLSVGRDPMVGLVKRSIREADSKTTTDRQGIAPKSEVPGLPSEVMGMPVVFVDDADKKRGLRMAFPQFMEKLPYEQDVQRMVSFLREVADTFGDGKPDIVIFPERVDKIPRKIADTLEPVVLETGIAIGYGDADRNDVFYNIIEPVAGNSVIKRRFMKYFYLYGDTDEDRVFSLKGCPVGLLMCLEADHVSDFDITNPKLKALEEKIKDVKPPLLIVPSHADIVDSAQPELLSEKFGIPVFFANGHRTGKTRYIRPGENTPITLGLGRKVLVVDVSASTNTDRQGIDPKKYNPVMEPDYISDTATGLYDITTHEACVRTEPCAIGVVLRAEKNEDIDVVLQERFSSVVERSFGSRVNLRMRIDRGIAEYEWKGVTYLAYVDNGDDNDPDNIDRIERFKGRILGLQRSGEIKRENTFVWVLSNSKRDKGVEHIDSLRDLAYLTGLKGQYLPISWQMFAGPLFADYIASINAGKEDGENREALIDMIIESISMMESIPEDSERLIRLRDKLSAIKPGEIDELDALFNGVNLILNLPDIVPEIPNLDRYRKIDKEVLSAL